MSDKILGVKETDLTYSRPWIYYQVPRLEPGRLVFYQKSL